MILELEGLWYRSSGSPPSPVLLPGADLVEGQGDGLVGLAAQGAVAHGRPLEPLEDLGHRLHLVEGDAAVCGVAEVQQAAQVDAVFAHVVHRLGELLEGGVVPFKAGLAEQIDGLRG